MDFSKINLAEEKYSNSDVMIIRGLASQVSEIAQLPHQESSRNLWKRLNSLKAGRPLLHICELPWHEMNYDNELTLQCESDLCRSIEAELRQTLYLWRHVRGDMVVEPVFYCPMCVEDTGVGFKDVVDEKIKDDKNSINSKHFTPQIIDEKDLDKFHAPVVTHHKEQTRSNFEVLSNIFGNEIEVKVRGVNGYFFRFAPWDDLVRWWGIEEALIDLYDRPEMVHEAMNRLVDAHLVRLDQYEEQNLLTLNNGFAQAGSGAYGYTDELPSKDFDPKHIKAKDLWGSSTAQIFVSVSPEMHDEFAITHELKWMERFGLNYYGCCEPLHHKVNILKKVPNLRKISMSRWVYVDKAVENVGNQYVFSYKPNAAIFAVDNWSVDAAEKELRNVLVKAKQHDCKVEIIMKNITTVLYEPKRVWDWMEMATKVVHEFE